MNHYPVKYLCAWRQPFDRFDNQSIDNMSGKKGKSKGAESDSGEASGGGGGGKGGTSVKVNIDVF